MAKVVERMIANNLVDFEGLKMEGTVVVNENLINAFIQDFIQNLGKAPEENKPASETPELDFQKLLHALCIDHLNVHLQEGKMHINFKISK